jgi:hypothetical protein
MTNLFLKGGEVMHFRKLVMTGIIAGTALFLPEFALAEKAPEAKPGEPLSAAVQDNLRAQPEQAKAAEKITAEPAAKKEQAGQKPLIEKPVIEKPVQAKAIVHPPQAKKQPVPGKAIAEYKKSDKAASPVLPKKAAVKKVNPKITAKPDNKEVKKATVKSRDDDKDIKPLSTGIKEIAEPAEVIAKKQISDKGHAVRAKVQAPPVIKKKEMPNPPQKERYPKGDNLPNPPSRTKASGGPSSDRTNNGTSSFSFLDKWFIWDHGYEPVLTQPFTSRASVFISQWVNAPPSPPPTEAPAFLPYTDGISHG